MSAALHPAKAMFDPLGSLPSAVEQRNWILPLLLLSLSVAFSGAAFALRYDAKPKVIAELTTKGDLAKTTEQEVTTQIETAERIVLVGGIASGIFVVPLKVLLLAVILKLSAWLFGVTAPFARCFSAAALALLPIALFNVVLGASVLNQPGLVEGQLETLVPSSLAAFNVDLPEKFTKVGGAIDLFKLWSVALLGFGFAAASGMRKPRALLLAVVLYAMYISVFLIGLPAIIAQRGSP